MKYKHAVVLLLSMILICIPMLTFGEELPPAEEEKSCLDGDSFSRYVLADPLEIMPNADEDTTVYFNFQCDQDASVEVLDDQETFLDTIISNQFFSKGDNQFTWDGKINGDYAEDGTYTLKIVPIGDDSQYAFSTEVKVYHFKYPSLIEIYGEEFKSNLRQHRKENE